MAAQHKTLAAALIAAQQAFAPVVPDQNVAQRGKTKDGREYQINYKYADLAQIIAATNPALHANGLVVVQGVDHNANGNPVIVTRLLHDGSDQQIETRTPVLWAERDNMQKYGGAITYTRRYALKALLNIADEDDDGQEASKPAVKQSPVSGDPVNVRTGEVQATPPTRSIPDVKEREQRGSHTDAQNSKMWAIARSSLRMSREQVHKELFDMYGQEYGWGNVDEVSVTHLSYKTMDQYITFLDGQARMQGMKSR